MTDIARLVDTSIFVDYLRGNETAKEWMNSFPKSAHHYGFTICTLNDKHFNPFADLKVEHPY